MLFEFKIFWNGKIIKFVVLKYVCNCLLGIYLNFNFIVKLFFVVLDIWVLSFGIFSLFVINNI